MSDARPVRRAGRRATRLLAVTAMISALSLGLANAAYADVTTVKGSAYGVSASLRTLLGPLAAIAPTPTVTLPATGSNGPLIHQSTTPINLPGLLHTGAINVATAGTLGASGQVQSGTEVHGIVVADLLQIDSVGVECTSNATGSTAKTIVGNVALAGQKVAVVTLPNTTVNVPGVGVLHINEQAVTGSGASTSITVTGVRLTLNALGLAGGEVIIGRAVCGVGSA
jgi:hypothetical protein